MKKKIIKLWGVGMIVVLMASLLIVGATPASAGTLAYTAVGIPGALFNQLSAGTDVALVRVAPNGDIFAVDPANAAGGAIYKSVDGGRTWGLVPVVIGVAGDVIADIQISPSYETDGTVMALVNNVAGNAVVYISNNYGVTYTTLGAMVIAAEVGTSLAISPLYNGGAGEIMVGTQVPVAGFGDVYIWGQPGFTYVWNPQNIGGAGGVQDVTAVAFSPNYAIDFTIIAVGSTAAGTMVHTKVGANAWDATVGLGAVVPIATAAGAITEFDGVAVGTEIISATLAIPSDFRASLWPIATTCYVAVRSERADDKIYRVNVGGGATAVVPMDPNAAGFPAAGDDEVTSLAYAGTGAAGMLYIGYAGVVNPPFGLTAQVYRSSNAGTALPTFTAARPQPTGTLVAAGQLTYVALAADYTTSNRVYAGTIGANSALSISDDGGASFYQAGLIDTTALVIDDFVAASATELFLVTNGGGLTSVWKSADSGATWYRYMSTAAAAGAGIIRLSPTYATDNFVLFGNNVVAANNLMTSSDGGIHWAPVTSPIAPVDIAVVDAFTYLVAGAGVQRTVNGGWTWQLFATPTGAANDIDVDTATGHILVGLVAGGATLSTNNNFTYVGQGVGMTGPTIVVFDSNYATNNVIYAADAAVAPATAGVQRYVVGSAPGTAWAVIDLGATVRPADIISAPDGTLYASDFTAGGGIQRSINPTAPVIPPVPSPLFEAVAGAAPPVGDGLPAGATLTILSLVEGSNIVYALNTAPAPDGIVTYTDTMTQAIPTAVSPAEGDVVLAGAATVSITPIPGVIFGAYQVQWNTRPDWLGVGNAAVPIPAVVNAVNLTVVGPAVPNGATIYYRVRAIGPVFGPWSATVSFSTELVPVAPNAPGIIPAAGGNGNTGPGGFNTPLTPTFSWGTVGLATGYELRLATDSGMTDIIVDLTGPDALGNTSTYALAGITLEYGTTYYWQVRGVSATSNTAWSPITSFTTMQEPVPTQPPVTVTDAPDIIITIPPAPPGTTTVITNPPDVVEKISEGYIYAIIIIGAVLVIAVIVLIVRTRRTV